MKHFAREEEGGFFVDIASQRPSFDRRVTNLLREHKSIQGQIKELLNAARADQTHEAFVANINELLDAVEAHEQSESALIQDSTLVDIGPSD